MSVFFVATVSRQVEGEMISVRFEKAFLKASKADAYAKDLSKTYTETIQTPTGPVQFVCQRGVHECELDEEVDIK